MGRTKKADMPTPEAVAKALAETNGLVFMAAERLKVSARTVYRYGERYPSVREAMEHQKGKRLDTAEASLWRAVLAGEAWAVCFYLKTQGKQRGYVERREIDAEIRDRDKGETAKREALLRETYAALDREEEDDLGRGDALPAGAEPLPAADADDAAAAVPSA